MKLGMSWLDLKLGIRMLVRYPGLTVVAVFALSVAIAGGAAYLEPVNDSFYPRLAFADGERIVGIYHQNAAAGGTERRVLRDFVSWRAQLQSVDDLGAFAELEANLITDDGRA